MLLFQNGLIPWYKTMDYLVLYPFPEYKEVPLYVDTRQDQWIHVARKLAMDCSYIHEGIS